MTHDIATGQVVHLKPPTQWALGYATDLALTSHWHGLRKYGNCKSWCEDLCRTFPDKTLFDLSTENLATYLRMLRAGGLSEATLYARMSAVRVVYTVAAENGYTGPWPSIPNPHVPKPLKWWLTPDMEEDLMERLVEWDMLDLRDFVLWTIETGLRIEESLRVHRGSFYGLDGAEPVLIVPGTKNALAQSAMPITEAAARIAKRRLASGSGMLFTISYDMLHDQWTTVRKRMGWWVQTTSTLKALRRSFARRMSAKGMPTHILQQAMRHGSMDTTEDYLRLVGGGYTLEEMRKWM
jgi:integrase